MAGLFDIAGKSALVTGGSRGIGLMIARGYVEASRAASTRRAYDGDWGYAIGRTLDSR